MKIIKVYQKFITERSFSKNSVIDDLFRKDLEKKIASGKELTLIDIVAQQDVYCGNHTNPEDDTEVCGYHYGEAVEGKRDEWVEKVRGMKCPGCGGEVGETVLYVGPEELDSYEEKLPGDGFYIFSKEELKSKSESPEENTLTPTDDEDKPNAAVGKQEVKKVSSPKEISLYLQKNIRPITLCYLNILPEKFKGIGKGKMNEKTIQDELLKLQRECNYGDPMRAKEAIASWNRFISPVLTSDAGKSNMGIWLGKSDGKKYGDIVKDFESMLL